MLKKRFFILTIIIVLCFSFSSEASVVSDFLKREPVKDQKTVVIMYHMISENPKHINTYCITPKELETDINYLKENNYVFSCASEIEKMRKENPDKNIAVLTFDDGYESDYKYVLPILEKYDAKATFFVFSGMLGEAYYMNEKQLKVLSDSPLTEIGNHSYEMHNKTLEEIRKFYSFNNLIYVEKDFLKNKKSLEKIIDAPVKSLSYPNGIYTILIDNMLKEKGICQVSFSTQEILYSSASKVIGRYNRSDKRNVKEIIEKKINGN